MPICMRVDESKFLAGLAAVAVAVAVAGCCHCVAPPKSALWKVRLIRPDGGVQRDFVLRSASRPTVWGSGGGQTWARFDDCTVDAPTGWLIDIEPASPEGD